MSTDGYLPPGCTHRDVDVHVGAMTIISVECPACGELNDPLADACVECGAELSERSGCTMAFTNLSSEHESNPRRIPNDDSAYTHYVVKQGVTIHKGSLVVFEYDSGLTGYVTYASNTASETFAGVAAQNVTGDGTAKIRVWRRGLFEFLREGPVIRDVGTEFYCDGDIHGTPAKVQSNAMTGCKVGCCVDYLSWTVVLAIDNYCP